MDLGFSVRGAGVKWKKKSNKHPYGNNKLSTKI